MGRLILGVALLITGLFALTVLPALIQNAPGERLVRQELKCGHLSGQPYQACAEKVPTTVWDWLHTVTSP